MTHGGPAPAVSEYRFEDLSVGQQASFVATITEADLDRFAAVSGDISPIHIDAEFARARGFPGRVVHGAFLSGLISRLVGVYLPGRNGLVQSMTLRFRAPVIAGASVSVMGEIDQLSEAVSSGVMIVTVRDRDDGSVVASGKVAFGFS